MGSQLYCQILSERVFVHQQRGFTPTPGLPSHKLGFFPLELSVERERTMLSASLSSCRSPTL